MNYLVLLLLSLGLSTDKIDYEKAHLDRKLKAVKVTEKIAVDGRLEEPIWNTAPLATNFIQTEPVEGDAATEKTDVRILYDAENIYFGVYAYDSKANRIVISDLKKDFSAGDGDSFELILDTFHDRRNGYQFAINPAGAKWDAQMINEGREVNSSWDGVWHVKTSVVNDGWTAEIAIPFKSLKFRDSDVQTWGMNFHRNIRSDVRNEDTTGHRFHASTTYSEYRLPERSTTWKASSPGQYPLQAVCHFEFFQKRNRKYRS